MTPAQRHDCGQELHANLVLVSFTNAVASPESLLALVDISTGYLRRVDFLYELNDFGATGITRLSDGSLIVALAGSQRLVRLSTSLVPESEFRHEAITDVHGLTRRDESLYAVSTGTDSVLEFRVLSSGQFELLRSYALTHSSVDSLHVNSACVYQGRVLVSMFGANWRNYPVGSPIGDVIDLETRQPVSRGLRHPHTLSPASDALYILSSYSGTVERLAPNGERTVCASYSGYLRGMSVFDRGAVVGVSAGRRRSRGLGTENVDMPGFTDRCGVLLFDDNWELVKFVDLTWFGREIFDLLLVQGPVVAPSVQDTLAAAKHRSLQLEASWEAPVGGPVRPERPISA